MKPRFLFYHLMFLTAFLLTTRGLAEAQPSVADTVRFLEQSTFGPTTDLITQSALTFS